MPKGRPIGHDSRTEERAREELKEFTPEPETKFAYVKVKTLHTSSGARFGGY